MSATVSPSFSVAESVEYCLFTASPMRFLSNWSRGWAAASFALRSAHVAPSSSSTSAEEAPAASRAEAKKRTFTRIRNSLRRTAQLGKNKRRVLWLDERWDVVAQAEAILFAPRKPSLIRISGFEFDFADTRRSQSAIDRHTARLHGSFRRIEGRTVLCGMEVESESHEERVWSEKDFSLVFCRRIRDGKKELLLGMKKRGFGIGKWNGYGGKLEGSETIEECAVRELHEECGIQAREVQRLGYLYFKMMEASKILRVHVYQTWNFENEAVETDEMRPQWYAEDDVPFAKMWADDAYWFPYMLSERRFVGRFVYEDDDTISDYDVKEQ